MNKFLFLLFFAFINISPMFSQLNPDADFYKTIPEVPAEYTAGTVASRVTDGLGFRFYWATEGLGTEEMDFRLSEESRSIGETVEHIYNMTWFILKAMDQGISFPEETLSAVQKREIALQNIHKISSVLKSSSVEDFQEYTIELRDGDDLPFWNLLNGPIADCIWHAGQIAILRRQTGNPFNPDVSLMNGKLRNSEKK